VVDQDIFELQPEVVENTKEPAFEELLQELTELVERLEPGNLPLAEALQDYEKAVALLNQAREILNAAQARLHVLMDSTIGPADQQLDPLSFLDNK
jgi:exodeoxyribonuclease VII small subunit